MKNSQQQDIFYKQLGRNICSIRRRLGLSQDELARAIGLKRTSLTNIENGRQHPPLHTFCDIADQLNVDALALLPVKSTPARIVDVKAIAGEQVHGEKELAFIASGLGIKKEEGLNGNSKEKNRGAGADAAGGKRG